MLKTVEIEVDDDLVQAVIRKYRLAGRREAVHLALRTLLSESDGGHLDEEDEYDEFSDLNALRRATTERHRGQPPVEPWFGGVAGQAVTSFRPAARLVATGERPP